ncbi:MAG TPA: precorrin-6Y C5,15-methyltransferase (decarboxylating) subunit CbiT, partial [Thiothrix sp.]|nr:precorrin-6Y C5,15-methyltransferase (decarboxylating) subunit CbiT [Thiothrix sp.]
SEQVSEWLPIKKVVGKHYAEPNVVILQRIKAAKKPVLLGCKDETYFQRKPDKGLITKQEIRAISLAKMQLKRDSIVWDIGAGSGSIGLEAAHLCPQGRVYAIEKNGADYAIVQRNLAKAALSNYHIEQGKAPDGLYKWPDADAIFIGGSGGNLANLIRLCLSRLKPYGTLVMNFITLENLSVATETLKQLAKESAPPLEWHFIQLQVSRSKPILTMQRLEAENPVTIVSALRLAPYLTQE